MVKVLPCHGRWASDFSTLVSPILSTYNPIKNQESQRSSGEACAEGAGAPCKLKQTTWIQYSHRRFFSSGWPSAAF